MNTSHDGTSNLDANATSFRRRNASSALLATFILLGVLAVSIMIANYSVIYLVRKKHFLKTATNACLVSLAVSDFLAGAVAIPMLLACNLTFNRRVCIAMDLCARFIAIATVLHLLAVTLERYLMIVHAMSYSRWVTKPRVIGGLVALWLFSLALCLVQLGWTEVRRPSKQSLRNDVIYDLVVIFIVLLPSFSMMVFSFCRIFATLRAQLEQRNRLQFPSVGVSLQRRNNKPAKERKAVLIFCSLTLSFFVCWFSYFLEGLRGDLGIELEIPLWVQCVLVILRFSTSLTNPLAYTLFKMDFRKALRLIFWRKISRRSRTTLSPSVHRSRE